MFGISKKDAASDQLTVQVHVISSAEAYNMVQNLWNENIRTLHLDAGSGKEFLHFAYVQARCVVWLQRDRGRTEPYELVVRWDTNKMHEVFIISNAVSGPVGDDKRAKALLNSMLTTPSVVPSR